MRGQSALGLGFLFRFPVVVVVVVVVPVIVLFLRRKWRQSVARSEEVRRLLVSASEESTRAELAREEAYYYGGNDSPSVRVSSPHYDSVQSGSPSKQHYDSVQLGSPLTPHYESVQSGSPSKPQYQCAVCFRPTTTRCSKCKSVRYCSGKCQIVHWRQGHKDECCPYVPVTQINNVGGSSNKQGDHKDHGDNFDTEAKQTATSAESKSPPTPTSFSAGVTFDNLETVKSAHKTAVNPARKSTDSLDNIRKTSAKSKSLSTSTGFSAGVTFENPETVKSAHKTPVNSARKSTDSLDNIQKASAKSKSPSKPISFSAGVAFENLETVKSAHKTQANPARKSTDVLDNIQKTSNLSDEEAQSGTSSSSFWTDDGSNESSLSEPSTNSSINEPDDVAPGSVGETEHGQLAANHKTEVTSSNSINNGFHAAKVIGESDLRSKKSNDITDSSTGMVNHRDRCADSDLPTAPKYLKVSEKSNDAFGNNSTAPDMSKARDSVTSSPKAPDTCLKTVTSRNVAHSTKPVMVIDDANPRITTSSSQSTEATRRVSKTSKSKVVDHLKSSKLSHQQSLEGGSDTTHNYSFKGLFPYEMFVKLYNCKHVELQPCGLKNCGNSCYANAVLQCLIYTPPLTAYLLEGLHSKACEKRGWCFTCELEGLVRKAKDGISPLSPIHILTHIENIGSNLGHGKEEDAHEFLRYVIDALQSVCIKESRKKSLNPLEEETTLIGLTFGGYLRSKIMCMKCGGKSEQHERMMDLTVEIEGGIRTLEEALNKFTCTEILDGENKYKCNRCKSYEKAKKKFALLEAPNVLTIALKRFQSGKFGKINKSIKFPEILDMAPYVSGSSDKSPIYSLYGVVVHVDTMNAAFSGHYVCYVKNLQNRWFKFDDSVVIEVDLKHVLTKEAYMLLYARCSLRAPRSIRSSIIHHHHHHDSRKHKIPPPSFTSKSHSTAPWDACNYQPPHARRISLEDESTSSDNSSFFAESCSCSTESTRSIEDHINLNSSDSDTSSSSSFPSPLYSKLARLYASTSNHEEDNNNNNNKISKVCRNLDCSCNSCRITNLDRLGGRATNPTLKPSVTVRRSTSRGKTD
ncbi:ubiquitin carboxyl-terminal hydrolase 17-like isoform X2 [Bidens hawaiensis]|uniref:ubiquitin carboxyl-terminal hydrolase 17-like isoform X2 n=1 Tax=Bidens hawaiensis TaxID=980011 RepID=UPI004049AC3B